MSSACLHNQNHWFLFDGPHFGSAHASHAVFCPGQWPDKEIKIKNAPFINQKFINPEEKWLITVLTHLLKVFLQCADIEPKQSVGLVIFQSVSIRRSLGFFFK